MDDFKTEYLRWIMLLLSTVRLTDSNVPQLVEKFLSPKRGSIIADREYRNSIAHWILEELNKSFPVLSVISALQIDQRYIEPNQIPAAQRQDMIYRMYNYILHIIIFLFYYQFYTLCFFLYL